MTDLTALRSLLERLAGATEGDWRLSREIGDYFCMPERYEHPGSVNQSRRPYTTSLDAAVALVEAVLPEWLRGVQSAPHRLGERATIWRDDQLYAADALTPALALVTAAVKALIAQSEAALPPPPG